MAGPASLGYGANLPLACRQRYLSQNRVLRKNARIAVKHLSLFAFAILAADGYLVLVLILQSGLFIEQLGINDGRNQTPEFFTISTFCKHWNAANDTGAALYQIEGPGNDHVVAGFGRQCCFTLVRVFCQIQSDGSFIAL